MSTDSRSSCCSRLEVEEFLIEEAAILDDWRLDDWLALFTEDAHATSSARPTCPTATRRSDLTLVDDDHLRLTWRVNRFKSRHAHREFPWSRTRRLVTNVRVLRFAATSSRSTGSILVVPLPPRPAGPFVGRYLTRCVRTDEGAADPPCAAPSSTWSA